MRSTLDTVLAATLSAVLAVGLYAIAIGSRVEAAYIPVPSGTIAFFNRTVATGCPTGWTEFTAMRGRYVVGVVAAAASAGLTDGTALTSQEDRPVGQHNHTNSQATTTQATTTATSTQGTHVHLNSLTGWTPGLTQSGPNEAGSFNTNGSTTAASAGAITTTVTNGAITNGAVTVNNAGTTAGTNAPYLQLLVCAKS